MSMTMLEGRMGDRERDKGRGRWDRDGGTLTGWWMTSAFTYAFARRRIPFRNETEGRLIWGQVNPRVFSGRGVPC